MPLCQPSGPAASISGFSLAALRSIGDQPFGRDAAESSAGAVHLRERPVPYGSWIRAAGRRRLAACEQARSDRHGPRHPLLPGAAGPGAPPRRTAPAEPRTASSDSAAITECGVSAGPPGRRRPGRLRPSVAALLLMKPGASAGRRANAAAARCRRQPGPLAEQAQPGRGERGQVAGADRPVQRAPAG